MFHSTKIWSKGFWTPVDLSHADADFLEGGGHNLVSKVSQHRPLPIFRKLYHVFFANVANQTNPLIVVELEAFVPSEWLKLSHCMIDDANTD